MTIRYFGSGDNLYISDMLPTKSSLGSEISYTHPDWGVHYSRHGWAMPLTCETPSYAMVADDLGPKLPSRFKRQSDDLSWLLIDHTGSGWKVKISFATNEDPTYGITPIHNNGLGWFIGNIRHEADSITKCLIGFLATNPTEEGIHDFWYRFEQGERLRKISIKELTETLNECYPPNKD
jgi:hypothetical protein